MKFYFAYWGRIRDALLGRDSNTLLNSLLEQADPQTELSLRMYWLERLLNWLNAEGPKGAPVRARYFWQSLEKQPKWRKGVSDILASLLRDCDFVPLLTNTGLSAESGLFADFFERALDRIFPRPQNNDFESVMRQVVKSEGDIDFWYALPDSFFEQLLLLINESSIKDAAVANLNLDLERALLILSANINHHGLSSEILSRIDIHPEQRIHGSPHFRLATKVQNALLTKKPLLIEEEIDSCIQQQTAVFRRMESTGASIGLVHRLEILRAALERLAILTDPKAATTGVQETFVHLAHTAARSRSLRSHLRRQFYFLSRKIVERNGQSGVHVVCRTPTEYRRLFVSSLGAGFIVVLMTLAKGSLLVFRVSPVTFGLGVFIVYSVGFITMQLAGFTLATKLPSFTASHLASLLSESKTRHKPWAIIGEFRFILLSQIYALAGNLVAVVPFAMLLSWFFRHWGWPVMSPEYAHHVLGELHPWRSGAILLGALTGAELWISALCGGWFENLVVFRAMPKALATHTRLRQAIGESRAVALSEKFLKNSSGIAANLALGFLFGFVPLLGQIMGINLDGKHVTISSTAAVIAVISLDLGSMWREWGPVAIGLFCIGLMNLVVSFSLALLVAMRAQNLNPRHLGKLWLRGARMSRHLENHKPQP